MRLFLLGFITKVSKSGPVAKLQETNLYKHHLLQLKHNFGGFVSTVIIKLFPTYRRRKQRSQEGQVSRALCPEQGNAQQEPGVQGTLPLHFKEFLLLKQPLFPLTEALAVVTHPEILKGFYR